MIETSLGEKKDLHPILNKSMVIEKEENKETDHFKEILPSSLSKDQREIFENAAILITEKLGKFLKKYDFDNGNLDLEKAAKLSYELTTSPEYIGDLFACNKSIHIFYRKILEKAYWQENISFERIHDILIRHAHHFLLSEIVKPQYLLDLARNNLLCG